MKKILSLDGGGIRGIIPGQILVALEEKLKAQTGDQDTRIVDHFDFFAGTSTGGILTCLLLCPSRDDPKKARFKRRRLWTFISIREQKFLTELLFKGF